MPNLGMLKLIGYGIGALAVVALVLTVLGWKGERDRLRAWQGSVLTATRDASANPKLRARAVPQQISEMGKSIVALKEAIARQNAAVTALGTRSAEQQAAVDRAISSASERVRAAEAAAERLRASARAGGLPSASQRQCEPSKVLQEQWR